MKSTEVTIRGLTPLIMHSSRLADPLDSAAQALAKLTSKRKKTLDDHMAVRECEWRGSFYLDAKGHPCLPGEVLEACLVSGAKRLRHGQEAKAGIIVDGDFALVYDGPKTIDGLWKHGGFLKKASVRVQKNRVIRSRPIFPEWECTFEISWDPMEIKDEDTIWEIVKSAGQCGVGDWRPKFGRFEIVE